jgi:hypothetical protein
MPGGQHRHDGELRPQEPSCFAATCGQWRSAASLQPRVSACFDAANATYAGINAVNPAFKKIYEDQAEFRKESFLWLQLSEYTFDTFMMVQQRSGKL